MTDGWGPRKDYWIGAPERLLVGGPVKLYYLSFLINTGFMLISLIFVLLILHYEFFLFLLRSHKFLQIVFILKGPMKVFDGL